MPAPFYNAIKGTTSGTPGTGAFTPNAAASTWRAWSIVPTGWIGLVRFDDASNAWELCYCYWNGTTLSRAATQVLDSSAGGFGVQCTLTSAATATMAEDASDIMSHLGSTKWGLFIAVPNSSLSSSIGISVTTTGTGAAAAVAATNYLTQQVRLQITSVTTANGQAGLTSNSSAICAVVSTTAGSGGFEMTTRFGASALPTGPRLFAAMTSATIVASTAEPSAFVASYAGFTLDSGDTNIQFTTSNAGTSTKQNTGIPLTANGWYETCTWCEPGSNTMYGLIIRLDTGAIWLGKSTTNLPASGSLLFPQIIGGLNGTNTGTAYVKQIGSMVLRTGF